MMERRTSQETPVDLIEGGQFLIAEEIFSERRTDDPMEMVVRAEVEMYFGRLDQAGTILEQVAPRAADIDVAARFSLAAGRLELWRGDCHKANTHLQTAYYFYNFQQDPFRTSQALLELGRLARLRVELEDANSKLTAAFDGIKGRTSKRSEFLRGQVSSELGRTTGEQGYFDQAIEHYANALKMLKATERGRYYARTLVSLALLKCQMGEYQDSLELFKEANIVFERYDLKQDLSETHLELARALMRLQRYERAERLCEESRDLRRGSPLGEAQAFSLLAILGLKRNGAEEAAGYAANALEMADESNSREARAEARITVGQVKLLERDFPQAAEILNEASSIARGDGNEPVSAQNRTLELEATIYLAEAYHNTDTRAGRVELARGAELMNTVKDFWLGQEYARVANKYEEQIVFTEDNRLVFDGNQLPKWQEAKRTLEGFLLRNALRQTNNSLTKAARKLGVSKVHVHNLKKKHNI
ncbi:MAG TPA: tetratricopeptide repeat protein [Blastocatellia bacterium]|nr:tetratricopeptide repeat protein [Blastocatellia bacterium]